MVPLKVGASMNMLDKVKIRLEMPKTDSSKDELLELRIEDWKILVMEYCSIKALTPALEVLVADKVVGSCAKDISSVTRGDTTIKYSESKFSQSDINILNKYKKVVARWYATFYLPRILIDVIFIEILL